MSKEDFTPPWWLLPRGRLHPAWWAGITVILLIVDYFTGLHTQWPAMYVVPVALAAWYSGRWPALAMAIAFPVAHVAIVMATDPAPIGSLLLATFIRGAVILVMALSFARLSEHEHALYRHVRTLEGLLPICSFCKNIRNDAGEWEKLETFLSTRSEVQFSHSFCEACGKAHYPDFVYKNESAGAPLS